MGEVPEEQLEDSCCNRLPYPLFNVLKHLDFKKEVFVFDFLTTVIVIS
jgi:hypothetical protein